MIFFKKFAILVKALVFALLLMWGASYFYYIDFAQSCVIRLRPGLMSLTEFNHGNIRRGIRVLKHARPEIYKTLCTNIDVIESNFSCGGWQGGCHYGKVGEITLSTTRNEFIGWTAAIIGHELCHDIQLREGRSFDESECYQFDSDILQSVVHVYQ
jgi:hypothetical protein